jgi:large subunit ribosomal protein L22
MEYTATAKYIRMSTRKLRLVADGVRKMKVDSALVLLAALPKRAAEPMQKVVSSAVANANGKAKAEDLWIKQIEVMGGPALKRWHAVSRGMAHAYKKRMTHVKIVLTDEIVKK